MKWPDKFPSASISVMSMCALLALGCGDAAENDSASSGGTSGSGARGGAAGKAGGSPTGGSGGCAGYGGTAGGGGGSAGSDGGSGAGAGGSSGGGGSSATGGSGAGGGSSGSSGSAGSGGSVGSGGSAGSAGAAGSGGSGGAAPSTCNQALINAGKCAPQIQFQNDAATGAGRMFDQVIPDPVATMKSVACQVCTILYRDPAEVPRNPATIRLRIYDFDGVANAGGGNINFSSRHVANYTNPTDALFEYLGVLIHETTHLYQNNQGGGGLVEGMADFVRIRAGHHRMNRRRPGGAWTDPYTTSGFFFSWLAGPGGLQTDGRMPADRDIGWAINRQMRTTWSEQVFVDRLGQNVNTLWNEYQNAI